MDSNERRQYFETFTNAKLGKVKQIIQNSSDDEIGYLSELIINYKKFVTTKSEEKRFKRYQTVISRFVKRKWSIRQLKNFFIKHSRLIVLLVVTFLSKVLEGFVCGVLSQNE